VDGDARSPTEDNTSKQAKKVNAAELQAELEILRRDAIEAQQAISDATPEADRCESIFRAADARLRRAIATRDSAGLRYPLLDHYDDRMRAGHAWNPHRSRLRDAIRWHKAVCDEIMAVSKKLSEINMKKGKAEP
jgi:hypothetical protein